MKCPTIPEMGTNKPKRGKSGGKGAREKGARFERALAQALNGKRVPLSGASAGFKGDVVYPFHGRELRAECKSRKKGEFKTLRKWLGDNHILALKDNNEGTLIVMRLEHYVECING